MATRQQPFEEGACPSWWISVSSRRSPPTRAFPRAQPPSVISGRWPGSTGTGGRNRPDWVAGLLRIGWPVSAGTRTRTSWHGSPPTLRGRSRGRANSPACRAGPRLGEHETVHRRLDGGDTDGLRGTPSRGPPWPPVHRSPARGLRSAGPCPWSWPAAAPAPSPSARAPTAPSDVTPSLRHRAAGSAVQAGYSSRARRLPARRRARATAADVTRRPPAIATSKKGNARELCIGCLTDDIKTTYVPGVLISA